MKNNQVRQVVKVLNQTIELLTENQREDLAQDVVDARDRLLKQEKTILVCGEFKRGKSSLLNALLEQKGLCPVDIDIATSVVSLIRYGETPRVIRHIGDIGGEEVEEVPYDQLGEFATGAKGDDTWLLEIELPSDTLKNGLVFIDTPGVGGLDPRHQFLTSHFLPQADISLFVVDAGEPLSDTELTFLRDQVAGRARQVMIVVNKSDRADDIEETVQDVRAKVTEVLGGEVAVIPASSQLKLDYLDGEDEEDYSESNFAVLETKIAETIATHSGVLCDLAVEESMLALKAMREPLMLQSSEFGSSSPEDLKEMQERCLSRKKEMEEYTGPTAEWRTTLNMQIQDLKRELGYKIRDIKIDFDSEVMPGLLEELYTVEPQQIISKVEDALNELNEKIENFVHSKLVTATESIGSKLLVNKIDLEREGRPGSGLDAGKIMVSKRDYGNVIIGSIKRGWMGVSLSGASVGLGASVAVIGPLVPLLGGLAGVGIVAAGFKESVKSDDGRRKTDLEKSLRGGVAKSFTALERYGNELVKQSEQILKDAILKEANRVKDRYEETAEALTALMKQSADERAKQERLVKGKLAPIDQMLKYYERLDQQLSGTIS